MDNGLETEKTRTSGKHRKNTEYAPSTYLSSPQKKKKKCFKK